ncbi:uncharacterized protein TNCT_264221 [Trichonephila clavata]|uniref:Uncharacterized protein n=1 Tax=Trichonephila clavata TaxID=2740835 RepID=A0A8X6G312_TRICU|nr:uncharacterized protein TNCT_264221 [Trichonephila clavata]
MDSWIENRLLKKTDVVSSNPEIAESTDTDILESAMPSTSSSVQLQPHLPTLPSSNFEQLVYQRKYVNMILVTCRLDLLELGTTRLQMRFFLCNKILANSSLHQQN